MLHVRTSLVVLITGAVLAGCGLGSSDISGEFTLLDGATGPASNCYGEGGYSDVKEGLSVTVRNESGTILATSRLERGSLSGSRCVFSFTVTDVARSDFYSVEVGRRGELTYSHDEMVENDWQVFASLG